VTEDMLSDRRKKGLYGLCKRLSSDVTAWKLPCFIWALLESTNSLASLIPLHLIYMPCKQGGTVIFFTVRIPLLYQTVACISGQLVESRSKESWTETASKSRAPVITTDRAFTRTRQPNGATFMGMPVGTMPAMQQEREDRGV
jgi:hypothetical protein